MAFETLKVIKDYEWGCGNFPYVEITDPYECVNEGEGTTNIISSVFIALDERTYFDSTIPLEEQAEVLEGYAEMFLKAAEEVKEQQRKQHLKQMAKELEDKNESF